MLDTFFLKNGTQCEYKVGEVLVDCNSITTHVFYLESGYVKASLLSPRGNEHILIFYKQGEIFPARWAFTEIKGSAFYTAITPVVVNKVPKLIFTKYLMTHPKEMFNAVEYTTSIMDVFVNRVNDMAHLSAYLRLIGCLLSLAERFGTYKGEGILIEIPLTHHDLACTVAMARETMSREMSKLEKKGLIEYRAQLIYIVNRNTMKSELNKV